MHPNLGLCACAAGVGSTRSGSGDYKVWELAQVTLGDWHLDLDRARKSLPSWRQHLRAARVGCTSAWSAVSGFLGLGMLVTVLASWLLPAFCGLVAMSAAVLWAPQVGGRRSMVRACFGVECLFSMRPVCCCAM